MNIFRFLRHLFCRNVIWRYPLTCRECGYRSTVTAGEVRDAKQERKNRTLTEEPMNESKPLLPTEEEIAWLGRQYGVTPKPKFTQEPKQT